jgi:small subunit ribosomal protein S8
MPTTDPIADMLNRIRNANIARKEQTDVPFSKLKEQIAHILKKEGFIKDYQVVREGSHDVLRIFLKYGSNKERGITGLKRISKPGLRIYVGKDQIPRVFGGLALVILSTNRGILSDKEARKQGVGGEVLCYVW